MKNRNPLVVFLLSILTCGIYSWYWFINTKDEMNSKGEKIPTAWIWLIPLIGQFWWYWKYSEGVEHVSQKELNIFLAILALYLLGPIGMAIVQEAFNRASTPGHCYCAHIVGLSTRNYGFSADTTNTNSTTNFSLTIVCFFYLSNLPTYSPDFWKPEL